MGKIMLNGVDYSAANVSGGASSEVDASSFMGKNTNFVTSYQNGGDANNFKTEYHGFVFNMSNTPENYGFLDVTKFDGTGFSLSPQGVIRQVFTAWSSGAQYVRCHYGEKVNEAITYKWSGWRKHADENNSVKKSGDTMNGNLTINTGTTEAQVNVKNNSDNPAEGRLVASTAGNLGIWDTKNGYWMLKGDKNGTVTIGSFGHGLLDGRTQQGIPIYCAIDENNRFFTSTSAAQTIPLSKATGHNYTTAIVYFRYLTLDSAQYIEGSFAYSDIKDINSSTSVCKYINEEIYLELLISYNSASNYYQIRPINTNSAFYLYGVMLC